MKYYSKSSKFFKYQMKVFQGECEYQSLMNVCRPRPSSLPLQPPSAFKNLGETTKRLQPSYRLEMNLFYSNAYPPSRRFLRQNRTCVVQLHFPKSKQHSSPKSLTIFYTFFADCRVVHCGNQHFQQLFQRRKSIKRR